MLTNVCYYRNGVTSPTPGFCGSLLDLRSGLNYSKEISDNFLTSTVKSQIGTINLVA